MIARAALVFMSYALLALSSPALARAQRPPVFMEDVVDVRPKRVSGPAVRYPDVLREAKIGGQVLIEAIIDTSGHVEPSSVKVMQSPNPGFDFPAKDYVLQSVFRPGREHGRPVRVLVYLPVDFRIKR